MRLNSWVLFSVLCTGALHAATVEVQVSTPAGAPVDNAVVYAIPPAPIAIDHKVAVMDQKNRTFVPHVLPIQTGTWVEFPNSDNVRHTVYSTSPAKRFQLPLYAGKPAYPIQFTKPGTVLLGCNIHEQMSAYIVVVDTPYFTTTANGKGSIPDVRTGQYTFKVWYPGMRNEPKAQSVMIGPDGHATVSFTTN